MRKVTNYAFICVTALIFSFWVESALNQELDGVIKDQIIELVTVEGVRDRLYQAGELKDSISKTELVNAQQLKDQQASSLIDALQSAIGIRVSNECSMCGAKRVMINGLKGEHTNVLVDGIPVHTMISGFYGLDAVSMTGVGSIEIARGAGASLISPEAIGGTINLVSKIPTKNQMELDLSKGEGGYQKFALMLAGINSDGTSQGSLVIQSDARNQFDGDHNGVSESPYLDNKSVTINGSHDFNYSTNVRLRLNHTNSEVFGGPMLGGIAESISLALSSFDQGSSVNLFNGNDVNERYIGEPWETAEWVSTERQELVFSLLHDFDSPLNATFSVADISHIQDSFYEGIDYFADDAMRYIDARFNYDLSDQHFLTFGADNRSESMRSVSRALVNNPDYMSDSFDYDVLGIYIQDSWTPNDKFNAEFALRFDQIEANFISNTDKTKEIDQILMSPRVDMRYRHGEDWESRWSFGRGYRAPLSFFESDHGILDAEKGYLVDITEPERSIGVNYSLNYAANKTVSTLSFARTKVDNLATLDKTASGVPVLTQLPDTAVVDAFDWVVSYQWTPFINLGFSAEVYNYNSNFMQSFAIAPIEKRVTLNGLFDRQNWRISAAVSYIADRNLIDYDYGGFDNKDGSGLKPKIAPAYINTDMKVSYKISNTTKVYFGALNLFDYNQAADESSPLLFDEAGGYDVTYIFAPLRGRTAYFGFDLDFG
jgi:outer membrane receptor protein involved in Fe transport